MEYKILKEGNVDRGYGNLGICLGTIFSVQNLGGGKFNMLEECDGWYHKELTKDEILLMLEELKHWINKQ